MYNTPMSKVYISQFAGTPLKKYLTGNGYKIIEVKSSTQVYEGISSHPDIFMCKINGQIIESEGDLGYSYPENIKYNGIQIGNYFVHNTNFTAPKLMAAVKNAGLTPVHVNQGYTKCNVVLVDDCSIITSDEGIARTLGPLGIHVLLISPGSIKLKGFPTGFLGGTSGVVGDSILFNGDLSEHPDYIPITNFIFDRGLRLQFFDDYELEDIGSIMEVDG